MEEEYVRLAALICSAADKKSPGRLVVGIAGPPGSGKSTIAEHVVKLINGKSAPNSKHHAQDISLDGFHYTRRHLDGLPNREEAYIRRGCPWTFDVDGILNFVHSIADSAKLPAQQRSQILAPSFDHSLKDPIPDDVLIDPNISIVILDGNYLLLDEEKWRDLSGSLDFKIIIEVDSHVARTRVAKRHVAAGIEPTIEKGEERFDSNDAVNGDLIRKNLVTYDLKVESL